jgi:outer membrane receptor protein involved in Fe transport
VGNKLDLFSNFTLYANDQVNGDQIEQTDGRLLYGAETSYEKRIGSGAVQAFVTVGAQLRADDVETSLWHSVQRRRLEVRNHTDNQIKNIAAYAEAKVFAGERLRIYPGLRVDGFSWNVSDLAMTNIGGSASAAIVSPKLSVELASSEQVSLFANSGAGFHSNDARSAVSSNGSGALARALGAEVGARVKPHARARVSADVWYLHLSSEQVWSGDAGGTEPSDATRRFGLDMEGSIDATDWLSLDANVTWAKATTLALAPRWMGSGGVSVHDKRGFVSVRARGIGDRPGNDDGSLTAEGYVVADIMAGKKLGKNIDLNLTINNVFDAAWREAQFAEESRVTPTAGLMEQMHYTPGMPLTATLTAAYTY